MEQKHSSVVFFVKILTWPIIYRIIEQDAENQVQSSINYIVNMYFSGCWVVHAYIYIYDCDLWSN